MSWRIVAERNARDPYRSRSLWVHLGVFVVLFGVAGYLTSSQSGALAGALVGLVAFFVPLVALAVGYQSVAQSRQNGGLRVVLSYPHTRREVVVGTAIGRAVVMALLVTAGFVAAALVSLVGGGVPEIGPLAVAWALGVLLGASIVSFAVGLSASVRTTNRAAVGAFGTYLLFLGLWGQLPGLVRYVLNGFSPPQGPTPEWALVFNQLNPITAFQVAGRELVSGTPLPGDAFYTTAWFGVLVLVLWLAVPLVAGMERFERSDL
ncbi:ABC transporter permease subunit [Halorussus amylolyticus]|uniref:ABC transporter permease subunit n=1 Tax=Halorussus amylolyticus TaxID=1126242 RepID=UPI00104C2682|nr:ABC transporter permease subunit [Halorussus amylolyticus]